MKLVFFIGSMNKGGAERVFSIMLDYYSKRNEISSITLVTFLNDEISYELPDNIKIINLSNERGRIRNSLYWLKNFRKIVKDIRPDYIISFIEQTNNMVLLSTLGLKMKIIISERNNPKAKKRTLFNFFINLLTKVLYRKATNIVFQTIDVKEMYSKKIQNMSVVIENPVISNLPKATHEKNEIVAVGRLEKQKNYLLLIKSFSEIIKIYPEYKLYIYGEGGERNNLEALIKNLDISEFVFLMGKSDRVHEKIYKSKIFIMPSLHEGMPNSLIEAMSMGMVIIGSDCIGIKNIVSHNVNGILFDNNSQEDLTNKIREVISKYDEYKFLGLNAKEESSRFEIDKIMDKWNSLLGIEREKQK